MKNHTKVYFKHFNYGIDDIIPCEICGNKSVDIHHIYGRGKGKDTIGNLMALCREHHNRAHGSLPYISKKDFQSIHDKYIKNHGYRL